MESITSITPERKEANWKPRSYESQVIERELLKFAKGEILTRGQLSERCGFDPWSTVRRAEGEINCFAAMGRVRDSLKRRGEGVWDFVRGVEAIKRFTDSEVIRLHGDRYRKKAGQAARRGQAANTSVDYASLPQAVQREYNIRQAQFGALKMVTGKKGMTALEESVDARCKKPNIVESMQDFLAYLKKPQNPE